MSSRRSLLMGTLAAAAGAAALATLGRSWWHARERNLRKAEYQRLISKIERLSARGKVQALGMAGFMSFWSDSVLLRLRRARFPLDAHQQRLVQRGSLLLPPAPDAVIEAAEGRLQQALPDSARALYGATNGLFAFSGYGGDPHAMLPLEKVARLREADPELVRIWTEAGVARPSDAEYFVYGQAQDVVKIRTDYMPGLLCLTPVLDGGALLLNPAVRFPSGELEAWDFSVKHPGAIRYQSLAAMLEAQCEADCWNLDEWSVTHGWRREG